MQEPTIEDELVPGRNCDGCAMCCKLVAVREIDKPEFKWCPHCLDHSRCAIYEDRPRTCCGFYCQYRMDPGLDERWKPSICRIVVAPEPDEDRLSIYVDPSRPHIWRSEPFYSVICGFGLDAPEKETQVIVWQGQQAIAILPDREKKLGRIQADQMIITTGRITASGPEIDVTVVDNTDPLAIALKAKKSVGKSAV